jgi:hypothetical protein
MRLKEQFVYRIRSIGYREWEVYEYHSDKPIRKFNDPLEAAHWVRERLGLPIIAERER